MKGRRKILMRQKSHNYERRLPGNRECRSLIWGRMLSFQAPPQTKRFSAPARSGPPLAGLGDNGAFHARSSLPAHRPLSTMPFNFPPIDRSLAPLLRQRLDAKAKPLGSLGRLEELALQLGLIQNTTAPNIRQPQTLVFAGDHGAVGAGLSAYPQEVTWQMVENFLAGGAAINAFSRIAGLQLKVVDAGVAHDFGPRNGLIDAKIAHGTANYLEARAIEPSALDLALERGRQLAHDCARAGSNALGKR